MPLTLIPPRQGKSRNYTIRGTMLGRYVDRTTGVADPVIAEQIRARMEVEILEEVGLSRARENTSPRVTVSDAADRLVTEALRDFLEQGDDPVERLARVFEIIAGRLRTMSKAHV